MTKICTLIAVAVAGLALAACETRPLTCGEYPDDGSPAVIRTRDQQVCEAVRLRVIRHLSSLPSLAASEAEVLYEKVLAWRFASTLEGLYARAEKDGGPELAAAVRRGVESVRAETTKPVTPECEKRLEKCLTAGAVKGAELAMGARHQFARGTQHRIDGVRSSSGPGSINIEDMTD